WVVNSARQIFQRNGSTWKQQPGTAVDVGIGSTSNGAYETVYIVDPSGRIYRFFNGQWGSVPGGLTNIAGDHHGNPWGVNAGGQIWGSYVLATSFSPTGTATTFTGSRNYPGSYKD